MWSHPLIFLVLCCSVGLKIHLESMVAVRYSRIREPFTNSWASHEFICEKTASGHSRIATMDLHLAIHESPPWTPPWMVAIREWQFVNGNSWMAIREWRFVNGGKSPPWISNVAIHEFLCENSRSRLCCFRGKKNTSCCWNKQIFETKTPFTNRHSRIDSDGNTPQQTTLRNKHTNGKEKVEKRRRIVVETYNIIRVYSRRVLQCVAVCCGVLPSESQCVAEFLLKLRNSGAKATCC